MILFPPSHLILFVYLFYLFKNQVNEVLKRKRELNLQASQKMCDSLLEDIVNGINQKIEEGIVADMDALSKIWNDELDGNVSVFVSFCCFVLFCSSSLRTLFFFLLPFGSTTKRARDPKRISAWRPS